jgi:hypothetical protein
LGTPGLRQVRAKKGGATIEDFDGKGRRDTHPEENSSRKRKAFRAQ